MYVCTYIRMPDLCSGTVVVYVHCALGASGNCVYAYAYLRTVCMEGGCLNDYNFDYRVHATLFLMKYEPLLDPVSIAIRATACVTQYRLHGGSGDMSRVHLLRHGDSFLHSAQCDHVRMYVRGHSTHCTCSHWLSLTTSSHTHQPPVS